MLGDELVPGMEKLRVQLVSGGQSQDCHSEAGAEESHRICTAVVQRKETLLLPRKGQCDGCGICLEPRRSRVGALESVEPESMTQGGQNAVVPPEPAYRATSPWSRTAPPSR